MRMAFDAIPEGEREDLQGRFDQEIAAPFEMDYRFAEASERKRLAIMVSREDHCLSDLLWRWRSGELGADVVAVVSNHVDHAAQVASLGLPFHHVPVDPDARDEAEARTLELARRRRPADPRPLHAGPLGRVSGGARRAQRSTSTTASCPPSSAPTPTTEPTSAGSS